MTNRREFIVSGTASAIALSASSSVLAKDSVSLKKGETILFQGDSITDAGRDKKNQVANVPASLGRGYPARIAKSLLTDHAALNLKIHNRGISGHKVPDLDRRWDVDTIELKPAILSILIGVNDIWHKMNGRYDGTAEVYRDGFAALLDRTKKALPDTTLVICEPFALRCGAVSDAWFPDFDVRKGYAKEVAEGAGALWVPFQDMFDKAITEGTAPERWAKDGVHPTADGHDLMAKTWREVIGI